MLLPPPNVTGQLHIGHALMLSIQDALARWYRMRGYDVFWRPGTDHAGIATQSVVERMLEARKGLTKEDLGRENFLEESLEYYTLDEDHSRVVTKAFVRLYNDGLIYRDTRMVNWSPQLQTAISDIEVVWKEIVAKTRIDRAEFGVLHSFAYPLEDDSGEIVVSTTRPETIPADRAIAVHPDDERYKHLHYKYACHPLLPIKLPIIPDADLVDPEFGTGAVKITPAHDPKDFAFWKRHTSPDAERKVDIPLVSLFTETGRIKPEAEIPSLIGKDRLEARGLVVSLLEERNAYRGEKEHRMRIATCERSGCIIEPMIQPQWYLKMESLAKATLKTSKGGALKIRPDNPYRESWLKWLQETQDWCLSRQIWWGHRVPAYRVVDPSGKLPERWIVSATEEGARAKMTPEEKASCDLEQDPDVLDTWFSSGLLPLSTAGWTGSYTDGDSFKYPLSFIESGGDILFFWLARMAMLCNYLVGELPFKEIILHPLVCDANGKKMSKSVGNVLDPLAVINGQAWEEVINTIKREHKHEIRQWKHEPERLKLIEREIKRKVGEAKKLYERTGIRESGADALRMALIDFTKQSREIKMDLRQVNAFRQLNIKLWNAVKHLHLAKTNAERVTTTPILILPIDKVIPRKDFTQLTNRSLNMHDWYMIDRLRGVVETCETAFKERNLYKATESIRSFIYNDFCDVFLEFQRTDMTPESDPKKRQLAMSLTTHALEILVCLMHPFAPFLTESIWQRLDPTRLAAETNTIMRETYPKLEDIPRIEPALVAPMRYVLNLVSKLRTLAGTVRERQEAIIYVTPRQPALANYLKEKVGILQMITKVNVDVTTNESDIVGIRDVQPEGAVEGEMVDEVGGVWQTYKETLSDGRVRTVLKF
ncbi:valyl-tRNA synthetase [Choiromyces venosus 120613-1]|uniref:valine--tRNA ligase n=1 Tax=Choiromyces venosus 120613-1 TaxID=1336337 RepID=A0A3N4K2W8_9PEZI|nr:valyl-tRNA synthetase [Choiromyces venosus 120613-1]